MLKKRLATKLVAMMFILGVPSAAPAACSLILGLFCCCTFECSGVNEQTGKPKGCGATGTNMFGLPSGCGCA